MKPIVSRFFVFLILPVLLASANGQNKPQIVRGEDLNEVPAKFGETADRAAINQARAANRLFDMHRRLKDAEVLIEEDGGKNAQAVEASKTKWK